jgi:ketosteroid isomerase-like protein
VTAEETVAFVRRAVAALVEGGFEAAAPCYAPDIVWDTESVGLGTDKGVDSLRRFFEVWTAAYEDWTLESEELTPLGDDRVFAAVLQTGRPAGSEARVEQRSAQILEARDGRFVRITNHADVESGRAAPAALSAGGT